VRKPPEQRAPQTVRLQERPEKASTATPSKKKTFNRTPKELEALASDPAHGGKIDVKSIQERQVGLDLEARGDVPGPITRDPSGKAEFIDATGQKWDVKGFNSNFPPKKGGFDLTRDANKIDASLAQGENVMLDTSKMSPQNIQALQTEGARRGWGERVKSWP
jgi:hypothetical protein